MSDYHYIDPRGRRSGPYTEAELKLLASRNLLEGEGFVELAGSAGPSGQPGTGWRVAELAWLAPAPAQPVNEGAAAPPPPPDHPHAKSGAGVDAGAQTDASGTESGASPFAIPPSAVPPRSVAEFASRPVPVATQPDGEAIPRSLYVLLALLPPFIGLFGIHNIVAGYTTRGMVALILSLLTFGGLCCICFPPCACLSVPVWIVLFAMAVIEAFTMRFDAKSRRFN